MARSDSQARTTRDATVGEPTGERREMVARHVMRAGSPSVALRDSLARAARLMDSLGTRELPVMDGRVLVGILTYRHRPGPPS